MTANKHTPGPWSYQEWGRLILDSGQGSSQLQVATVALNTRRDEGTANARLIAAAPELLEAANLIRAALQAHGEWDDGCFYYGGKSASELQSPIAALTAAIAKATGGAA